MSTIVLCHNTTQYLYLHYRDLIRSLVNTGTNVICVSPGDGYVDRIIRLGATHEHWELSQHGVNPVAEIRSVLGLRTLLLRLKPTRVMSFSIKPNLYAAYLNLHKNRFRHFCMVTGLGYVFIGEGFTRRLFRAVVQMVYRVLFSSVEKTIFQNQGDRDLFVERHLVSIDRTGTIPGTGIDLEYFSAKVNYSSSSSVHFLFVGRLLRDKGLRELLQAAHYLSGRGIRISILGPYDDNPGGLNRQELQNASDLGIVCYLGVVEDVRSQLLKADVFVLPSYREGLSRSILEAIASGLPVITTEVPGCRELVEDGVNGLLIPARDAQSLTKAMCQFIDNPEIIEDYGRASRRKAEQCFDVGRVNRMLFQHMGIQQCSHGNA